MADPQSTQPPDTIRFYFSFRSPYSWLAMHRLDAALGSSGLTVDYVPVFPPPNYANDPAKVPAKAAYIRHDIARIASAYGIPFKMPELMDCEWVRPHAAYLYAADQSKGPAFARALYTARFAEGKHLGDDAVIAACAAAVGLDPVLTIAAQGDAKLQERVVLGMIRGAQEDGIFGVPLFVFRGERYWGNDRVEWLLRAIDAARGKPVPDLQANLLSPVRLG
jgi:2-hydroxychromene-2-carboxylate isomerase